jgi:hypothetical protein
MDGLSGFQPDENQPVRVYKCGLQWPGSWVWSGWNQTMYRARSNMATGLVWRRGLDVGPFNAEPQALPWPDSTPRSEHLTHAPAHFFLPSHLTGMPSLFSLPLTPHES